MREELIEKLFSNECSEEELRVLLQMIQVDQTEPSPQLMEALWKEAQNFPSIEVPQSDRIYSKILSKVDLNGGVDTAAVVEMPLDSKRLVRRRILKIAASFLILVGLGVWIMATLNSPKVIQTAYGEQHDLELLDGSLVKLNGNSKLKYRVGSTEESDREVWLAGEAFFEVQKKPTTNQKFQVNTEDVLVEVLGTKFNVNSHGGKTQVYLAEGRIRLHLNHLDTVIMMEPGDLITYSGKSKSWDRKRKEKASLHTSWLDGVLIFNNASLLEVLQKIEDIYGVKFNVVDPVLFEREINFPLPIDEIETAISILSKTIDGLDIRKEGGVYQLRKK